MSHAERFFVEQNCQQELQGRGNVLQKADRGKAQAAGGRSEEQQRYGGSNAGHHQQNIRLPTLCRKSAVPLP